MTSISIFRYPRWLIVALILSQHGLAASGDWPMFRHDPQLTGMSPIKGAFTAAPVEAWRLDLGAATKPVERLRAVDLDGDGLAEILSVRRDSIACLGRRGDLRWEIRDLPDPAIVEIRDFAGNGQLGILASSSNGLESTRWMIAGATGKATRLYTMRDVFGFEERIGKILPEVRGEQLCAWWSGESPDHAFGSNMHGEGFLFSFENGVDAPVSRVDQRFEGTLFKPRHFFADYDQDGDTEMVAVSHQQAWFFDVNTNTLELSVQWPMIRTYSATLSMLPPAYGAPPALYSINPHIPGVERVDIINGEARVAWRYVAGGRADQYQTDVKILPGAPDPFVRWRADGDLFVLAAVENEHRDGKTWLVVLGGIDGARLYEEPEVKVLAYDDLDSDGTMELLLQQGNTLRIAEWSERRLIDRARADGVTPVFAPLPAEGDLGRSNGCNPLVQRTPEDPTRFLLRYEDGVHVCRLTETGLERGEIQPDALSTNTTPPDEIVTIDEKVAVVTAGGTEVYRHDPGMERRYLAPAVVVGDLGGERRVLVKDFSENLLSVAANGSDMRILTPRVFGDASVCDMDGDGENEVVTGVLSESGAPSCVILNAAGEVQKRLDLPENATSMRIGPTGTLGPGQGRWLALYFERGTGHRNGVVAYNGETGAVLWERDDYQTASGAYGPDSKVKFVLHIPTAVFDYDGDGSDDLLAASENFYGIMSVSLNKDLTQTQVFSDYIPGHWQAYASPIAVDLFGQGRPQVFHHKAYANTILTDLEGQPRWHWAMTRDRTASAWPGFADFDGDGVLEIVQTRVDGLLRAFNAVALNEKCPKCPPDQPLTEMNHGAQVRWEITLPPPISDLATGDLDGDAKGEVLFGAGDGQLYLLEERDGRPAVAWTWEAGRIAGAPILADLDGDLAPEILVPTADGYLRCLKAQ